MNPKCYFSNLIWAQISKRKWSRFNKAAGSVGKVQASYLLGLLKKNGNTTYGRKYGFRSIDSVSSYQRQVPITNYEDYISYINLIRQGRSNILTAEKVNLLEPTSGTTSATKLIPYTDSLKAEFQNGVGAWIYNLFKHYPELLGGKAYWSITPSHQPAKDNGDTIPIGFNEDSEYFGPLEKWLIDQIMVGSAELSRLSDMQTLRYATLLTMMAEPELRMISVWNPSYLELLLQMPETWAANLVNDIRNGDLHPPASIPKPLLHILKRKVRKNPRQAWVVERVFRKWRHNEIANPWQEIWPKLGLISCWADGWSKHSIKAVQRLFPRAMIQPKGLLATEAIVTFPLEGYPVDKLGHALAVTSHFFEFEKLDGSGLRLSHELEKGGEYAVIVTTGGGLYRYRLNDRVRVEGHYRQIPLLKFSGKTSGVSDLFGEKVNEDHLRRTLLSVFKKYNWQPDFYFVAPQFYPQGCCYTLFLETPARGYDDSVLQREIEQSLRQNFHYRYCRRLEQLGEFKVHRLPPGARNTYYIQKSRRSRLATAKYSLLEKPADWVSILSSDRENPQ